MNELVKVESLNKAYKEIKDLFENKIPRWEADKRTYDKVRVGFTKGDSNGWYSGQEMNIWFQAWCGTYGNSSTYKEFDIDGEIFSKHLLKYLNSNKKEIMLEVAKSIAEEAKILKEKATEELNKRLEEINSL